MDGASTDGSLDLIRRYENHFAYWSSIKDGGQAFAVKQGFEISRGKVLGFVNSDDVLLPGALAAVGRFFAQNRKAELLIGKSVLIDSKSLVTYPVLGMAPSQHSFLFLGSGRFNHPPQF